MAGTPGTRQRAKNTSRANTGLPAQIAALAAWARTLLPVRVFLHYTAKRGPLLSAGLSYQSIFAVFAALWVGFSTAGLFLQSQPDIGRAFFGIIDNAIPGLIDTGNGIGAINPGMLLEPQALSWTGAIALAGLLFTALGWLSACRDAIQAIFGLPPGGGNFFLLKLKDLGLAACFGVALIVSSVISVLSTQALGLVFAVFGIDHRSIIATVLLRTAGLVLMLVLDTAVLASLFRLLAGLVIPFRPLITGSLAGAIGLGALKVLGSSLLGGAYRNPLLASFAVIIGLLIWFNLVCQVILLSASWITVRLDDHGISLGARRARTSAATSPAATPPGTPSATSPARASGHNDGSQP
jgi:membrane protein